MADVTLTASHEFVQCDGRVLRYCRYGAADGFPVISESGSPSSRWKWPHLVGAMDRSKLSFVVYDRPGYGGSTRRVGRTVADAVEDVRALADAFGWSRFAVFGGSGGGPHALASAALLGDRVTRCAVLSGIKPADAGKPPSDEATMRSRLAVRASEILALIDAGGPEVPSVPGPPAHTDPDAMARIRATFIDGVDGWVDDCLAFVRPWGFDPAEITVPVGLWRGTDDANVPPEDANWLLANIPTAEGHTYVGGHLPGTATYEQIYEWLAADAASASDS